jgi:hypothetical protein
LDQHIVSSVLVPISRSCFHMTSFNIFSPFRVLVTVMSRY